MKLLLISSYYPIRRKITKKMKKGCTDEAFQLNDGGPPLPRCSGNFCELAKRRMRIGTV
jgi:hypothetical protein